MADDKKVRRSGEQPGWHTARELQWGLSWPTLHGRALWGARAIYNGRSIDLLHDRQDCVGAADARARLGAKLDSALDRLRGLAKQYALPSTDSSKRESIATPEGVTIHYTPNGSYGYLYMTAYLTDEGYETEKTHDEVKASVEGNTSNTEGK